MIQWRCQEENVHPAIRPSEGRIALVVARGDIKLYNPVPVSGFPLEPDRSVGANLAPQEGMRNDK
jgi:hypothetical protein